MNDDDYYQVHSSRFGWFVWEACSFGWSVGRSEGRVGWLVGCLLACLVGWSRQTMVTYGHGEQTALCFLATPYA